MEAFSDWHSGLSTTARNTYGVDPRVFVALVLISIPPFYVALAVAVRRYASVRQSGLRANRDATCLLLTMAIVGTWLLPYVYVVAYGRLPSWARVAIALMLAVGAWRVAVAFHRRVVLPATTQEAEDE